MGPEGPEKRNEHYEGKIDIYGKTYKTYYVHKRYTTVVKYLYTYINMHEDAISQNECTIQKSKQKKTINLRQSSANRVRVRNICASRTKRHELELLEIQESIYTLSLYCYVTWSLQRTKQRERRVRYKRRARGTRRRNKRYWKKRRNKARMVERRREKIDEERRGGFRSVRVIFTKSLCL